ncbi:MAG TPA: hypothetical protein VNA17_02045 [Pyrinomonadaceae bacterium]|nr:hypothetical protein [Pyrinomonadaceae bacterium]
MKLNAILGVIAFLFSVALGSSGVRAQDESNNPGRPFDTPPAARPGNVRNNALRQLGLSRDQMLQIQRINRERKPLMDEAQHRLRIANRALDEAIYADSPNEAEVKSRLKELHSAQADVARIRFMSEFAHRRVLTMEQVGRFRELRRRFDEGRQTQENRPLVEGGAPSQMQPRPMRRAIRPNRPGR